MERNPGPGSYISTTTKIEGPGYLRTSERYIPGKDKEKLLVPGPSHYKVESMVGNVANLA